MRRRPKKKKKTKRVRGRSKERPFVQNFRDKPGRQKMVRRLVKKGPQRRRKPTPPPRTEILHHPCPFTLPESRNPKADFKPDPKVPRGKNVEKTSPLNQGKAHWITSIEKGSCCLQSEKT